MFFLTLALALTLSQSHPGNDDLEKFLCYFTQNLTDKIIMDENIRIDFQEKDGFIIITPRTKELTYKNSKSFLSVSKHNITGESVRAILNCEHIEPGHAHGAAQACAQDWRRSRGHRSLRANQRLVQAAELHSRIPLLPQRGRGYGAVLIRNKKKLPRKHGI